MKKVTCFLLSAVLVSSLFLFNGKAEASSFSDIKNHWAKEDMEYLVQKGIIGGYADGTFRPNEIVTRAQAAIMIGRALGLPGEQPVNARFKDVPASVTGSGYIHQLELIGVAAGYGDRTYRPHKPVNRGDATIHLIKSTLAPSDRKGYPEHPFKDVSTSQASGEYVILAYRNGIVDGYADKTFRPYEPITRAQFSVFLSRSLQSEKASAPQLEEQAAVDLLNRYNSVREAAFEDALNQPNSEFKTYKTKEEFYQLFLDFMARDVVEQTFSIRLREENGSLFLVGMDSVRTFKPEIPHDFEKVADRLYVLNQIQESEMYGREKLIITYKYMDGSWKISSIRALNLLQ
ncbi:S-layer homology domain-containing protein [Bacillus sp. ISL-39]|uniref:S-layer homology domain-containing protein n=1 Tax=Bacillus sp. ISL-39 TaxID=2819124 RepID=UPI001BE61721|nr:S-layer homology domain-containing protein [Bacillus sp. ISL-39]MBT2639887.1 S-layer homology domain-containing protein [Bacillus sp. ISL-39]